MKQNSIRISLYGHPVFRRFLLANRLREHIGFVVEAAHSLDTLADTADEPMILSANWDRLLLEDRARLLHYLQRIPHLHVILSASSFSCTDARAILQSGRATLLESDADESEIEAAIHHTADHLRTITEHLADFERSLETLSKLTNRERQILEALALEQNNKAAARRLNLSPRTVEVHRANMIRRSGVQHLPQLLQMHLLAEKYAPLAAKYQMTQAGNIRLPTSTQPCSIDKPVALQGNAAPLTRS